MANEQFRNICAGYMNGHVDDESLDKWIHSQMHPTPVTAHSHQVFGFRRAEDKDNQQDWLTAFESTDKTIVLFVDADSGWAHDAIDNPNVVFTLQTTTGDDGVQH